MLLRGQEGSSSSPRSAAYMLKPVWRNWEGRYRIGLEDCPMKTERQPGKRWSSCGSGCGRERKLLKRPRTDMKL